MFSLTCRHSAVAAKKQRTAGIMIARIKANTARLSIAFSIVIFNLTRHARNIAKREKTMRNAPDLYDVELILILKILILSKNSLGSFIV